MKKMTAVIVFVFTAALCAFSADEASAQVRWVDYVVQEGDTCSSIALEAYGSAARYDLIHQANDLGSPPHDLEAGTTLRLPRVPEALLAQERGPVMLKSPEADWSKASAGDELYRAWRLNTLARARALLSFRDASELILRENTLVVIYGGSAERTEKRPRARLESGALRARLGELSGGSEVALETESASSITGDANVLVTVDEQQTSRVANHGGDAVAVAGRAGGNVAVDEGFGSQVDRGKPPAPPRPLPPAPSWEAGPTTFPSFGTATVRASWEPVADAQEYFVELTADRRGIRVMESVYVPSDVTALEVEGLDAGTYFATVSAIDGERFESIPSERRELQVVRFTYDRRGQVGEQSSTFVAGTRIVSPAGMNCDDADADGSFVAMPQDAPLFEGTSYPGHEEKRSTRCVGADGAAFELSYVVTVPSFTVEADSLTLVEGRTVGFDVVFDGPTVDISSAQSDFDGSFVATSADRGRLQVRVPEGFDASTITLGLDGSGLLALPVEVRSIEAVAADPSPKWYVGAGTFASSGTEPLTGAAGVLTTARASAGLLGSPFFRAGLIADAGVAISDPTAGLFGLGFEAVGRAPLGSVAPFLALSFEGWFPTTGNLSTAAGATIGLDLELAEQQGVRLYGGATVFDVADDYTVGFGGGVGYYWSF